jgi:coiled-coil-helix-coiled-coil-helix domain-containing protein 2
MPPSGPLLISPHLSTIPLPSPKGEITNPPAINSGVAVGSSIGHAIGGFFGGGSSSEAAPQQETAQDAYAQPMDNGLYNSQNQTAASGSYGGAQDQPCMTDVRNFTRCMDDNQGNMSICGWYMEQLKACQQAAKPY